MPCEWNNPGSNPFRGGDVSAALGHYNYSPSVKTELTYKIKAGYNDAVVYITKDSLLSPYGTASNLRDMHYRGGSYCAGDVGRSNWSNHHTEKALVYCVNNDCVAVPVVCGNISRIDYIPTYIERNPIYPVPEYNTVPEPSTLILVLLAYVILRGIKVQKTTK